MMSKKTLIAGPWVGEFGWELFAWQGYVRALSRHFEKTVVICSQKSKPIYQDFASSFLFFDKVTGPKDSFFMHNFNLQTNLREILAESNYKLIPNTSLLIPKRIGNPPATHWADEVVLGKQLIRPEYIKFNSDNKFEFDYVFHIRNREDIRPEDNWDLENWSKLKDLLGNYRVACIGTKGSSGFIEGTKDLRGAPLERIFGVLSSAKAIFGPSSGPMHLSSLCGCPHVVWSYNGNKTRYEKNWNPLSTPILFLDEYGWHPSPEYVYKEYIKWSSDE